MTEEESMITKQGLASSLLVAVEFGFISCEKRKNLQMTMGEAKAMIQPLVERSGLASEVLRISATKLTRHAFDDGWFPVGEAQPPDERTIDLYVPRWAKKGSTAHPVCTGNYMLGLKKFRPTGSHGFEDEVSHWRYRPAPPREMAGKKTIPRVVRCSVCKRKPCACATNAIAKVSRKK